MIVIALLKLNVLVVDLLSSHD